MTGNPLRGHRATGTDGEQAYSQICSLAPDLVLLDISMPRLDGLELLKRLHDNAIPMPTVIILSAYRNFSYAQQALHYGCREYLLKPFVKRELIEQLTRIATRSSSTAPLLPRASTRFCPSCSRAGSVRCSPGRRTTASRHFSPRTNSARFPCGSASLTVRRNGRACRGIFSAFPRFFRPPPVFSAFRWTVCRLSGCNAAIARCMRTHWRGQRVKSAAHTAFSVFPSQFPPRKSLHSSAKISATHSAECFTATSCPRLYCTFTASRLRSPRRRFSLCTTDFPTRCAATIRRTHSRLFTLISRFSTKSSTMTRTTSAASSTTASCISARSPTRFHRV